MMPMLSTPGGVAIVDDRCDCGEIQVLVTLGTNITLSLRASKMVRSFSVN